MSAPKYRDEIRHRVKEVRAEFAAQLVHELRNSKEPNSFLPTLRETYVHDKYKNFLTLTEMVHLYEKTLYERKWMQ